jgi:hypothetical protein
VIENIAYGKDRLQQQIARLKYQLIAIDFNTQLIGTSTFGMLELPSAFQYAIIGIVIVGSARFSSWLSHACPHISDNKQAMHIHQRNCVRARY